MSFVMGYNYWYNWTSESLCPAVLSAPFLQISFAVVLPAELNAAAVLIGYWSKNINPAACESLHRYDAIDGSGH